jgi:Ca-activated chloride channel family protein
VNPKSIAVITLTFLLFISPAVLINAQQDRSEPIRLFVTVTNSKGFVSGLTKDAFEVSVDKELAKIIEFRGEDAPMSVGLVLDLSGSMKKAIQKKQRDEELTVLQQALVRFFELSNESNHYFLLGVSEKPELLSDWTSKPAGVVKQLEGLKPWGNTALYDTCYAAMKKLQASRHSKRALIVITDGADNNSRYSFNDLRKLVRDAGVPLYSINFLVSQSEGILLFEGLGVLDELTNPSGGLAFTSSRLRLPEANAMFEAIAAELRSQYILSIVPMNNLADGKFHKIKVKVNATADAPRELRKLTARTREGFYASQSVNNIPQP